MFSHGRGWEVNCTISHFLLVLGAENIPQFNGGLFLVGFTIRMPSVFKTEAVDVSCTIYTQTQTKL
jgi:hypothetical protein